MDFSEFNYYKGYRCYHCGNNHVPGNCPFLPTINYIGDDFTRKQTYVDDFSRPSWNFEQDECWHPHVNSYSHAIDPPFMCYSHVQGNIDYENSCLERLDKLERLADIFLERNEKYYNSSGSRVQVNNFEDNVNSCLEERLDRLERLAGKFLIMLEDSLKWQEDSFKRLEDCLKRLKSIIEDRDDHEVKEDLEVVIEPETCLEEIDGCLIDVEDVNSNACDSDIHVEVSVPIATLDDSPITVVTLADESQIDFIGCSLFLERHISNSLYEHILIP